MAALVDAGGDELGLEGKVRRAFHSQRQGHGEAPAVEQGNPCQAAHGHLHGDAAVEAFLQRAQHLKAQLVEGCGVRLDRHRLPFPIPFDGHKGPGLGQGLLHSLVHLGQHIGPGGLLGELLRDGAQAPLGKGGAPGEQGRRQQEERLAPPFFSGVPEPAKPFGHGTTPTRILRGRACSGASYASSNLPRRRSVSATGRPTMLG